jgi:2-phospho-L-lactate transferase/gluconeogenesis factor (CofD/UPF0052 family)
MDIRDRSLKAMRDLIEARLPLGTAPVTGRRLLAALAGGRPPEHDSALAAAVGELRLTQFRSLSGYASSIAEYIDQQTANGMPFDYSDCSLGNLIFAGAYLHANRDFNVAVSLFGALCETQGRVINVTTGAPRVLVGLKSDGQFLRKESEIVGTQTRAPLIDIYLLEDYLSQSDERELEGLSLSEQRSYLMARERTPPISDTARQALSAADVIIYGPGTQHSSLFPSYLTDGVIEAIVGNQKAEKVFISNILKDSEIQSETIGSLVEKFHYYLSRRSTVSYSPGDVITSCFFQREASGDGPEDAAVPFGPKGHNLPFGEICIADWQEGRGEHSGGRVLDELISLINRQRDLNLSPHHFKVSIVVPGLNEVRTIRETLRDLTLLDFHSLGLSSEIIYVDGGSTDGSFETAVAVPGVRACRVYGCRGRGEALRRGISEASGNLIAFFPSDGEYPSSGLVSAIENVYRNKFPIVFGSRAIKCTNFSERLRHIYRGKYSTYLCSKYGGMIISIAALLLYNRWIGDPFTSVKAFDGRVLRSMQLKGTDMDLDTEFIARASQLGLFIVEIPVDFVPRGWRDGKKTTVSGGLKALWALVRCVIKRQSPEFTSGA